MKRYLEAGRLNSPRGIKGEVKFNCYCDTPDFLSGVKRLYLDEKGERPLEIVLYRPSIPSIVFKGYEDRTSASALTGRTVWFDREDITLEDGVFFYDDLIGTDVYDIASDKSIGKVVSVEEGVSSYYYVVKGEKSYRIPAVDEFVAKAIPEEGVWVKLTEGLDF